LDEPRNVAFLNELLSKLKMTASSQVPDVIVYRKPDIEEATSTKSKTKKNQQQQQMPKELSHQNTESSNRKPQTSSSLQNNKNPTVSTTSKMFLFKRHLEFYFVSFINNLNEKKLRT